MEIVCIFHVATLPEVLFKQFLIHTPVKQVEHIADREGQWILRFQTTIEVCSIICIFHSCRLGSRLVATLITEVLFEQFLICTAV